MIDLLLPSTDAGVVAQLVGILLLGGLALFATRHDREWRLVAFGSTLLILGFFGLRALH